MRYRLAGYEWVYIRWCEHSCGWNELRGVILALRGIEFDDVKRRINTDVFVQPILESILMVFFFCVLDDVEAVGNNPTVFL